MPDKQFGSQAKPSDARRWHKTRQPNPEMQAGIDARVRHHLSHAQIQIASGLAMNPKKIR
jgi:hypothetical protein